MTICKKIVVLDATLKVALTIKRANNANLSALKSPVVVAINALVVATTKKDKNKRKQKRRRFFAFFNNSLIGSTNHKNIYYSGKQTSPNAYIVSQNLNLSRGNWKNFSKNDNLVTFFSQKLAILNLNATSLIGQKIDKALYILYNK